MRFESITYMLVWEGQHVGTATYIASVLRQVCLTTPSDEVVSAVMALLPSREKHLNGPDAMLGAVNLDQLQMNPPKTGTDG